MQSVCSHRTTTTVSIWYNVCACRSPVYHYIAATTVVYLVQRIIAACVVVI